MHGPSRDQAALLFDVADHASEFAGIADGTERTRACAERLGLSAQETQGVLDRVARGDLPALGTTLAGGYHTNVVLSLGGNDVVVREQKSCGSWDASTWPEHRTLAMIRPQLHEIDEQERSKARQRGLPEPVRVDVPELLYAAPNRQIHRWFVGRHPNLSDSRERDHFLLRTAPEIMARFAQVRQHPPLPVDAPARDDSAAHAHRQVEIAQLELDDTWERFGDTIRELASMFRDGPSAS